MNLADKLQAIDVPVVKPRRGPRNECESVYGPGNIEDWEGVETLRLRTSWAIAQAHVDKALEVTDPIPNDKFRYHWRRKCYCWSRELRQR